MLTKIATTYIETWTILGEDDYYINLTFNSLRGIQTFLKNRVPPKTHHSEAFYWPAKHQLVKHTRLDTIEKTIKKDVNKNQYNSQYLKVMSDLGTASKKLP